MDQDAAAKPISGTSREQSAAKAQIGPRSASRRARFDNFLEGFSAIVGRGLLILILIALAVAAGFLLLGGRTHKETIVLSLDARDAPAPTPAASPAVDKGSTTPAKP